MFEKLSIAIKEEEELDERLKISITLHLQSLETVQTRDVKVEAIETANFRGSGSWK